jgi:hypothetical protein
LIGLYSQSEDVVDNLRGIENEPIDHEQAMENHLVEQLNDDGIGKTEVVEGTADETDDVDSLAVPGHLSNVDSAPSPFTTKQIKNILQTVMASYGSYGREKQFRASSLVLSLQELMLFDKSTHTQETTNTNYTVSKPTNVLRQKESKQRLKSLQEVRERSVTSTLNTRVQQMGLSQEIVGNEYSIVANPRKPIFHCGFCNDNHKYPECEKRRHLSVHAMEYMLSSEKPALALSLKNRLKMAMPVTTSVTPLQLFGNVTKQLQNSNFIVHEATEVEGKIGGQIESMSYCITFLDRSANPIIGRTRIWVTGDVMTGLINHPNKKIKWVFDETIIHKKGWVERSTMSTMSQDS